MTVNPQQFDVFISYNSRDENAVERIVEQLTQRNLRVWFNKEQLRPGLPWLKGLESGVALSGAIAVFFGAPGIGRWQDLEVFAGLEEQLREGRPVIPVLLPEVTEGDLEKMPAYLRRNTFVDFRKGLDDPYAIERLEWGITGEPPRRQESNVAGPARSPEATDMVSTQTTPLNTALEDLSNAARFGALSFLVGPAASCGGHDLPPSHLEITRFLLTELDAIDPDYDQLLPPLPTVADYFAAKNSATILENRVLALVSDRSTGIPSVMRALADLLGSLRRRPIRRSGSGTQPLVVTTNIDVTMERALLKAGVPFVRIVQYTAKRDVTVSAYSRVTPKDGSIEIAGNDGSVRSLPAGDARQLDDVIATHGSVKPETHLATILGAAAADGFVRPILYKYFGSQDVPTSCALSTEQLLRFAVMVRDTIPKQITEIVSNSAAVFLGFSFVDPEFLLVYHTWLREAWKVNTNPKYAIGSAPDPQADPYQRLESKIWQQMRSRGSMGINVVEEQADRFLEALKRAV